jgi:hypothetical protein
MAMSDASPIAAIITALITAGASLAVALIAGGFAVWNASKTNKNSFDIQDFKSATGRDLERLKAKLEHGQLISSTQWNVEFTAYQAIWQALVTVRNDTMDIATYEQHLETLDLLAIMINLTRRLNPPGSSAYHLKHRCFRESAGCPTLDA